MLAVRLEIAGSEQVLAIIVAKVLNDGTFAAVYDVFKAKLGAIIQVFC